MNSRKSFARASRDHGNFIEIKRKIEKSIHNLEILVKRCKVLIIKIQLGVEGLTSNTILNTSTR